MGTAFLTAAMVVAALVAVAVGLLFVPVEFTVLARTRIGIRFRVRWLFGLVRAGGERSWRGAERASSSIETAGSGRAKAKKRRPKRRSSLGRSRIARAARKLPTIEGLVPRAARLARELFESLGWRRSRIAVRAGTGDPADTGEICGLVEPFVLWLGRVPTLRVEFEPDFDQCVFEAEAEGDGRLVPARFVGAIGRFALSRPGRRAIRIWMWNAGR